MLTGHAKIISYQTVLKHRRLKRSQWHPNHKLYDYIRTETMILVKLSLTSYTCMCHPLNRWFVCERCVHMWVWYSTSKIIMSLYMYLFSQWGWQIIALKRAQGRKLVKRLKKKKHPQLHHPRTKYRVWRATLLLAQASLWRTTGECKCKHTMHILYYGDNSHVYVCISACYVQCTLPSQ